MGRTQYKAFIGFHLGISVSSLPGNSKIDYENRKLVNILTNQVKHIERIWRRIKLLDNRTIDKFPANIGKAQSMQHFFMTI